MEQLADEYQGKVKVFGLNVANAPDIAASHKVFSLPLIIFFKGGEEFARLPGGNRNKITEEMDKLL